MAGEPAGRFNGLVVLLTGAAGGFGRAAASAFAREGARLVLSDLDEDGLESIARTLRRDGHEVEARPGDVASEATHGALVGLAFEAFGGLDVAVNNAGIVHPFARLAQIDAALVERVVAVDLLGVVHAMRAQVPAMETQFTRTKRVGAILNVASITGLVGAPLLSVYAAAKHGVVGLTKSVAAESAKRGVRVNALCPSFADTAMVEASIARMIGTRDERLARVVMNVPMQRLATPDEVVAAMLFACDPGNGFMTGQAIAIDGGLSAI